MLNIASFYMSSEAFLSSSKCDNYYFKILGQCTILIMLKVQRNMLCIIVYVGGKFYWYSSFLTGWKVTCWEGSVSNGVQQLLN